MGFGIFSLIAQYRLARDLFQFPLAQSRTTCRKGSWGTAAAERIEVLEAHLETGFFRGDKKAGKILKTLSHEVDTETRLQEFLGSNEKKSVPTLEERMF